MLSPQGIRRRRQRAQTSFLPDPVNTKPIQIIPPIHIKTNIYYEPEPSPFMDAAESLKEALIIFMEAIQEFNCLGRACCVYVFSIKMNMIENTHAIYTFLTYYPTIVGWILFASKINEGVLNEKKSNMGMGYKQGESTHTFATVSSHMSHANSFESGDSEHSLDLGQMIQTPSQSWGQFAEIDASSITLAGDGMGNKRACSNLHNMFSSCQTTRSSNPDVKDNENAVMCQVETSDLQSDLQIEEADCKSDDDCMSQSELSLSNRNENGDDWGHYADFQDEEPRPEPTLDVMEKGPLFQQRAIDFYKKCRKVLQME
jgi:hypothetical protein